MTSRRPASYIEYNVTEAQFARMWGDIDERRRSGARTRHRRHLTTWGGLAVAAGVLLGWVIGGPSLNALLEGGARGPSAQETSFEQVTPPHQGATLRASERTMAVDLGDGSNIQLAPRSKLAMKTLKPTETRLALTEGEVTCDVVKDANRNFFVTAGPVSVRVIGTKFTVHRNQEDEKERISVGVERGIVEVTGPDGSIKSLSRGESWSVLVSQPELREASSESDESAVADATVETDLGNARPTKPAGAQARSIDLFAEARTARRAGNPSEAARLYEKFLTTTPSDGRAGVAALELGRLKMDQLGDTRGAIPWLTRAASLGAGGLGDDALARLVQARARLGQTAACQKMRERYLKAYPAGVHVNQIRALCP